eukprot:7026723-Lingulodinium_polyedra.AAC.1
MCGYVFLDGRSSRALRAACWPWAAADPKAFKGRWATLRYFRKAGATRDVKARPAPRRRAT